MSSTDHVEETAFVLRLERSAVRRPLPTPLRTALVTVYATTALLALLMPHAVTDWLDDLPPSRLNSLARSGMEPLVLLSDRLGLHEAYLAARRRTEALSKRAE